MSVKVSEWPKEIAWILRHLEPYEFAPVTETQMEEGVIRRRSGPPSTRYCAVIDLDEREFSILRSIAHSFVRVRLPGGEALDVVKFVASEDGRQTPLVLRESFTVGGPKTYNVRIDFVKLAASLVRALSTSLE